MRAGDAIPGIATEVIDLDSIARPGIRQYNLVAAWVLRRGVATIDRPPDARSIRAKRDRVRKHANVLHGIRDVRRGQGDARYRGQDVNIGKSFAKK